MSDTPVMRVNDTRKYPVRSVGIDDETWQDISDLAIEWETSVSQLTRRLYRDEVRRARKRERRTD